MGYYENEDHFINTLKMYVRDCGGPVELLPWQFYLDYIYHAGRAEAFTWSIKKEGVHHLEEPGIWDWLRRFQSSPFKSEFYHQFTDAFLEIIEELRQVPGVYSFWSEDDVALYVGRSKNLCSRISGSFSRFRSYDKSVYVRYIVTQTAGDAVVLEGYFIAALNPVLNAADNFQDGITVVITPLPEWSERIRCNWIIEGKPEN